MAGYLRIPVLTTLLIAVTSPTSCMAECDLSRDPTMTEVQLFLDCTRRRLYTLENGINDVILPKEPEIKRQFDDMEQIGRSVFPFRYEDMADFSYCHGLRPEHCVDLLRFLGQLLEPEDDSLSVRMRRSLDPKYLRDLLKQNRPGRILLAREQDIEKNIKWAMENGRGNHRSRWGRSTDATLNDQAKPVTQPTEILSKTGNGNEAIFKRNGLIGYNARRPLTSVLESLQHRQKRQLKINLQKLKMSPELQEILSEFKLWRSKHGYGKAVSRWG